MQLGLGQDLVTDSVAVSGGGDSTPGGASDVWLMEDGTSGWLMEDGSSFWLIES